MSSGNKSGASQLNGFTGDAGGNRLKKDAFSGRDLVPFFPDSNAAVQSDKQNGNGSAKAKVGRANGAPEPILFFAPSSFKIHVTLRFSSSSRPISQGTSFGGTLCRHNFRYSSVPVRFSPPRLFHFLESLSPVQI
jgi:hypothetical protein